MKTHYELLGLAPTAGPEDVKRAFRREIARYHPDKVQHLGHEFQAIASDRAAALTEAYRVLMDADARRQYDASLTEAQNAPPPPPPTAAAPVETPVPPPPKEDAPPPPPRPAPPQATMSDFVRRAVLVKIKEALASLGAATLPAGAFDAIYQIKGRKALFRKPEPTIRLAVKVVSTVDAPSVEEAWGASTRVVAPGEVLCLLLLGTAIAPAKELAATVSELRRKSRTAGPLVIPVDARDWEALLPPDTPMTVRSILDRLRHGQ